MNSLHAVVAMGLDLLQNTVISKVTNMYCTSYEYYTLNYTEMSYEFLYPSFIYLKSAYYPPNSILTLQVGHMYGFSWFVFQK